MAGLNPGAWPVTLTLSSPVEPQPFGSNIRAVAPGMGLPSRSHWYWSWMTGAP